MHVEVLYLNAHLPTGMSLLVGQVGQVYSEILEPVSPPLPCTTKGPLATWTMKSKEVAPRNSSTERNPSLPEDNQIMHSKIGLHLVKIHVLIIFLMSKVSKVLCMKYSRINCIHVGGVERNTCTHIIYRIIIPGLLRKS